MGQQPRECQQVQEAPACRGFTIVRRVGSFWDVGGAQACPAPGTLSIPPALAPKDPWGPGMVWGRGTGHSWVWSSLMQQFWRLSRHLILAPRDYGIDQTMWWVVSCFPNGIWAGGRGVGLFLHPKPSQPHCGGTEQHSRKGGGSQAQGTRWVWGPFSSLAWDKVWGSSWGLWAG